MEKQKREGNAVAEILATVLLFAIAVSVFSTIFTVVLSYPSPSDRSTAVVVGEIIGNTIVLTHQGGKSISFDEESYHIHATKEPFNTMQVRDVNGNNLWDIGEQIQFSFESLSDQKITVTVIDLETNDVILYGVFNEGNN
jgi:FlaG/FlaF family flagellin (archaellin)